MQSRLFSSALSSFDRVFQMPLSTDRNLTCRHWKLNPTGCIYGSLDCKYSHSDTGSMSPPVSITCHHWKEGCCYADEDDCLYSHRNFDTSLQQRSGMPFSSTSLYTQYILTERRTVDIYIYSIRIYWPKHCSVGNSYFLEVQSAKR